MSAGTVPGGSWRNIGSSVGLALIVSGQPLAWWVRGTFTQSESPAFPAAIVMLGFLMMAAAARPRSPTLHSEPGWTMVYPLLYLLPTIAMGLVDPALLAVDWGYNLFVILIVLAAAATHTRQLDLFPDALAAISALGLTLAVVDFALSPTLAGFSRLGLAGNNNPLQTGSLGGLAILGAAIGIRARPGGLHLIWLLRAYCIIIGLLGLILSNTRGAMISTLLCLIMLFIIYGSIRQNTHRMVRRLGSPSAIAVVFAALLLATLGSQAVRFQFGDAAFDALVDVWSDRIVGATSIFDSGYFGRTDDSVEGRVVVIRELWAKMDIWGHGIHAKLRETRGAENAVSWPHLTPFQAFYDLGFIGATVFVLLTFVVPVWLIIRVRRLSLSPGQIAIATLFSFRLLDHFTNATPYFWWQTLPVALVYVVLSRDVRAVSAEASRPGSA